MPDLGHDMMPRIETTLVHGYPGVGPYGTKGAGEVACVPPMAAIANAIFNATGVRIKTLPLSPENVLRGLRRRARRNQTKTNGPPRPNRFFSQAVVNEL